METLLVLGSSADMAVVLLLTAAFIAYAVLRSTGPLISLILALPVSGLLYRAFPYHDAVVGLFPVSVAAWAPLVLFGIFVAVIIWVIAQTIGLPTGSARVPHILATSVALTLMLVAFTYHVVPFDHIYDFGAEFDAFFSTATNFFWIIVFSVVVIFLI